MPVVDLNIIATPSASPYKDQFVVELQFDHDDNSITSNEEVVFAADQKDQVIAFLNAAHAADAFLQANGREPEEGDDDDEIVEVFENWFNYSKPGLQSWPSDSNGNYYGELDYVAVAYYDSNGTRFEVEQVKG